MKICPGCHRRYEDAVRFCPHDGIVLPDVSDEYVGRRLMEQFDILARCGEGAMGTVYRARQINMDRLVAVKILRRDLVKNRTVVKRFYREAKAAARLSHPNIITVHLVAETDEGLPYIVMEFLEGTDLDSLCKAEGALPIQRAVHLGAQIAAALSEAHRNDVVHRDLKPANIIVLSRSRPSEVVKVLDFGIAKILEAGVSEESRITKSGAIFGTPYYLSPEQATGAELDSRADLYSLGVILYRLLTGHLPFESGSGLEILVRHVKEPPPSPRLHRPELPASLEEVILTSLQKDRERRFKTADAMRNALLAAAQDLPAAPSHHGAASAWSAPGGADPSDGKKTVAGFAAAPGVEPGPPPSPEKDPLARAARHLLSSGEEGVPSKPIRESRPTVLGGPALGKDGLPATELARAQAAAGASGSPAAAKSGRAGTWRPTGESDLDTDDLPGASRIQSAPSAPAPIPKLILDQGSGRVLGGVQGAFSEPRSGPGSARVTAANADSDAPSYSAPASISRPQASRRLSEPASTDSSPSVVTGQHTAPSASIILALRKASRRGRSITFAAAALALVALGVGVFFALEDWRPRRSGAASQRAPASSRDASTAMAPERAAPDGQVSEPALAVGVELLRVLDQGVVARLSCEQAIKAGDEPLLVLDLWLDGRGRPIPDAEATLELARSARRKVKVQSSSTGVVGRYQFKASFPWPGAWAGTLEVRLPGEKVIRTPARLSVEPRPGSDAHPGRRRPPPPRDGPEPMDGLPRPPPDEGMTEPDRLPPPPGDPPVPPPDPD